MLIIYILIKVYVFILTSYCYGPRVRDQPGTRLPRVPGSNGYIQ